MTIRLRAPFHCRRQSARSLEPFVTVPSRPSRRAVVSALVSLGALLRHGMQIRPALALTFAGADGGTVGSTAHAGEARHGIAMHGEPALPAGFTRLPYADPAAPKGGRLVQGVLGTFDSLNPFVVKGIPLQSIRGYVVEALMARGFDEPFTLYGLIASSVELDAQRSYVIFRLNPNARFSDGTQITADDVIFSWELLRDRGRPNYRTYYMKVAKAEVVGEQAVRFDL